MKLWIFLLWATSAALVAAQCPQCATMKWGRCENPPACGCFVLTGDGTHQNINCSALVPKCFLMQAEMYRARTGLSTRSIEGKPHETAIVDNDGIYDPVCETTGRFRARQCNGTSECWCVNSAGVRRSEKGDTNINCTELVETYWIRIQMTHQKVNTKLNDNDLKTAVGNTMKTRYNFDPNLIKEFKYDPDAGMMVIDVKKPMGDRTIDLATTAYYMEKDVKVLPLFFDVSNIFVTQVGGQNLQMKDILVYYVDEKPPTFTMKNLSGGIIAVIVVVVLAVVIGLLVLFFIRRRGKKYRKAKQRDGETS